MNTGLSDETHKNIHRILEHYPAISKVVIFGSRAKGTHNKGSDIDLCLFAQNIDNTVLTALENELDDLLLPYEIDLCLFDQIRNPALKDHIQRVGLIFFERGKDLGQ